MMRLLILAYDFPPYVSVGGLRPYAWYKYLKEFGVEPVVVTRQWGNKYGNELDYIAPGDSPETIVEKTEFGTIIRTPYNPNFANKLMLKYGGAKYHLIRKSITAFYEFIQFVFFVGPKSGVYWGAKKYLKYNKVDAIVATVDPFVLLRYASALSRKYNVPWIADYRDPWVPNKNRSRFLRRWNAFLEKKCLANVNAMTTVDEFFKRKIGENVSLPTTYIIPNGFNPDSIKAVEHIEQCSDVLRIAMTGSIYEWHPYKSVISAFVEFVKANSLDSEIELNFFGINRSDEIRQFVNDNKLEKYIHIYPRMANAGLLENLRRHNVMLLFNDYSHMGTKIYDYLAIRRKIILCYGNDAESLELKNNYYPYSLSDDTSLSSHLQEDCLNETKSGVVVRDKNHLMSVLRELFNEFNQNGCVECHSINIDKYSRKEGARRLAEVVKRGIS